MTPMPRPENSFGHCMREGSASATLFVARESLKPASPRRFPWHHNTIATQDQADLVSAGPAVWPTRQQVSSAKLELGAAARNVIGVRPGAVQATTHHARACFSSRLTRRRWRWRGRRRRAGLTACWRELVAGHDMQRVLKPFDADRLTRHYGCLDHCHANSRLTITVSTVSLRKAFRKFVEWHNEWHSRLKLPVIYFGGKLPVTNYR